MAKKKELENRIKETLLYCLPHIHFMWAAVIVSKLLDCDFRDAETEAKKFLGMTLTDQN